MRLLALGAGALGKGSISKQRGTGRQLPLQKSMGGCCRAQPAAFAETGTVTVRMRDGERWEGGSGSAWFEHGAVGARMCIMFIALDNALSYCRGEYRGT